MFGLCALSRFIFLMGLCLPMLSWGQAQKGTIVNDGALIYQDASFDSPVINTLKRGQVFNISTGKKGPFYKIRLKPGSLGWVADTDIKPGVHNFKPTKKEKPKVTSLDRAKKRPFSRQRYRGPVLEYVTFQETTMSKTRRDPLLFYGFKWSGPNTLFDGDIYTDANVLFHYGAPKYYADITGKSADGWIILANFLFETFLPQGRDVGIFYGFGPMFKYSHFNLTARTGSTDLTYAADDMSIGAVFNLGVAARFGEYDLRLDGKYYWEKEKYPSLGVAVQALF